MAQKFYNVGEILPNGELVEEVTLTSYKTAGGFRPFYGPNGVHQTRAATPLVALG